MSADRPLSSPFSVRIRRSVLLALLATVAGFPSHALGSTVSVPPASEITDLVRAALPSGCTIQQTRASVLPPGWLSPDVSAVVVDVSDGRTVHTISFVSLDWIGVQEKGTMPQTVRLGATTKVIVPGAMASVPGWLDTFAPNSASLASASGTTEFHVGGYLQAELAVRTFLKKSGLPRDHVAASIIALGVPAEDLIRETALDARSPARLAAIRSLRHFPGKSTREALNKIIADRSKEASADACRIAALGTCEQLLLTEHGPAVLAALQVEKDETVAVSLANELNRLRYAPASAELRRWLKSAQSLDAKVSFARALATVRDTAAAGEIRAALSAPTGRRASMARPTDGAARQQLEIELQRLSGTWGPAQHGVRIMVAVESPDRVVLHVENMGRSPFLYIPVNTQKGTPWPVGLEVTLGGRPISPPSPGDAELGRLIDISRSIAPNSAACFELVLPAPLPTSGDQTLGATWFGLTANEVTLRSTATLSAQPTPAS